MWGVNNRYYAVMGAALAVVALLMAMWVVKSRQTLVSYDQIVPGERYIVVNSDAPVSPLLARTPTPRPTPVVSNPVNLLVNPYFEPPFETGAASEVRVAHGWQGWYEDSPPCRPLKPGCDLVCPDNCLKVASSSVLSGTDGLLTLSPVTLTVGQASRLTVTLVTTKPLQAADLYLFINPVVYTVSEMALLDGYAELWWARGIVRYDREVPTGTVGNVPLFALTLEPALTDSVHVEIVYWLWSDNGGMYETAWAGVSSIPRRLDVWAAAGAPACSTDTGCYWARPEFSDVNYASAPYRAYVGEHAQRWFTFGRMHTGGVYQQASGVEPGALVKLRAMMHGWMCYDIAACCEDRPACVSDKPGILSLSVGVDPLGGIDPHGAGVVWSEPVEAWDVWREIGLVTTAGAPTVTVFARSDARFDYARNHVDVYLGAAWLEVLAGADQVRRVWLPLVSKEGEQ